MNKSLLLGLILSTAATGAFANDLSKQNLVERSLVLKDSELMLAGGIYHGETNDENDTGIALNVAYGLTDNVSVGFGGVRYRFMERASEGRGLELTFGAGIKGHLEQNDDDILGYGADVAGKYVMSKNLAMTFGAEYVFWNKLGSDNASENRYSVGTLFQPIPYVTLSLDYTYRDLKDFNQDNAYVVSTGVHYALSQNTDLGLTFAYSDFDAEQNGFDIESAHKRNLGAYVSYRF